MARMLIVDDERNIRANLASFFQSIGHDAQIAESGRQARAMIEATPFDLVLTDFRMAEINGLELLAEIKRRRPECLVILMTAYATVENAVAAMKAGAFDYVTKPFSLEQIQHPGRARAATPGTTRRESRSAQRDRRGSAAGIGQCRDGPADGYRAPGRGKRGDRAAERRERHRQGAVAARQIHASEPAPRQAVRRRQLRRALRDLLESELFGHVRGAFTGAIKDKPGRFEAADGGTVFLDEIGDLPSALQTKLLRFAPGAKLRARRRRPDRSRSTSASSRPRNRDLAARSRAQARFREDLFYRLNVIKLSVPPLRERREDILPLAQWLLTAASVRNRRAPMQLAPEAANALENYRWPGNVRELRNALERAAVLSRRDTITLEDLPDSVFREVPDSGPAGAGQAASLEKIEREHIMRVLAQSATLDEAAATLGINVTTLWRKRKRYGTD